MKIRNRTRIRTTEQDPPNPANQQKETNPKRTSYVKIRNRTRIITTKRDPPNPATNQQKENFDGQKQSNQCLNKTLCSN